MSASTSLSFSGVVHTSWKKNVVNWGYGAEGEGEDEVRLGLA